MKMPAVVALAFSLFVATADAVAQSPTTQSPVFDGLLELSGLPTVYVTERTGREIQGKLVSLTESVLVVNVGGAAQTFSPADVVRIERRGDSLKNGAIIGAAIGLGIGVAAGSMTCAGSCVGVRIGAGLLSMGFYAAVGAGIDALIPGRTRIWPARRK